MTHDEDFFRTDGRSARSQRSVLLERDLRLRNQKYADAIAETKSRIANLEQEKARLTEELIHSHDQWTRTQFNDAIMELDSARTLAAACAERIAANQAAIQELLPNPEQLRKRRDQQRRLCELADNRLDIDSEVNRLIEQLRRVLRERGETSEQMRELAAELDLSIASGGLDEFRFEPLSRAISGALASDHFAERERWHGWFTGQRSSGNVGENRGENVRENCGDNVGKNLLGNSGESFGCNLGENRSGATGRNIEGNSDGNTYIVRDEHLTIPETLFDHGVYSQGDRIVLSEAEARELLREDRVPAAPTELSAGAATTAAVSNEDAPWRALPPSIMTTATYEEAAQAAREEGLTVREILLRQDIDRELREREAYLVVEEAAGARSRE